MPYVEIDMSKCESGEGKNFFDEFPKARETCLVDESDIICINGVWFNRKLMQPQIVLDNHTTI